MSFRRRALFLAGLFVAVSCSDPGNPIGPEGPETPVAPEPEEVLAALTCTVSPGDGEMRCAPLTPGTGAASGIVLGGINGQYVRLTKIGHNVNADSMWFGVTLQNLIGQTLGVDSLGVVDPAGIRIFFENEPSLAGPGEIEVAAPDSAFFAHPGQPYWHYADTLADSAVSAATEWKFKHTVGGTPAAMAGAGPFSFSVFVTAKVPHPNGWLDIIPDAPVVQVGGLDSLLARVRNQVGQGLPDGVDWTSLDTTIVKVTQELTDSTAEIQGVDEGTAYVKAVSAVDGVRRDSVLVTVNNAPIVTQDSISALENVTDSIPAPRLQNNVTGGDGTVVAGSSTTWAGGQAVVTAGGGLVYRAPAGYSGKDTVTYQVSDGTWTVNAKVVVQVEPTTYWYVRAGASGDGRDRSPFGTIAAAQAVAVAADSIFVLTPGDASPVDGPAVLKNRQALIGQGVAFDVTRNINGHTAMVFDGTGAAPGLTRTAAGPTVTVAQDNVIRGLGIASSAGAAISSASPFDSLYVNETSVSATGPALDLTTGNLDAVFVTLSAVNSTSSGITLTGVTGSVTATGGSISITGAGGTAVSITGGVNVSYPGNVTQGTNNPLLAVANHTGTLTFGGTFQAATGTGMQFNNASGSYTFNGAVTLSNMTGNFAGIDVRNSSGTFSFPVAGSSVTSPSGPGLYVAGGTATVTYAGTLTNDNDVVGSSRPLYVDGITGGAVTVSGAVSNTGPGILVEDNTGGTVTVSGNIDVSGSAGQGILVQNNSGTANIQFTGGTKHIHPTATITGVSLVNNTGATITFAGGGLNIDMPSGSGASSSGFVATGGGTVAVTGANNVINVLETAVQVLNTTIGAAGINLRSVTSSPTTATRAVRLASTGAGGLQITGAGAVAGSGGSLTSVDTAVSLSNVGGPVELAYVTVGTGTTVGVAASTFGTLTLTGASITTAGGPVLNLTGGALAGTASLSAPNSNTSGAILTNVTGSLTATGGGMSVSAVGGAGPVFLVDGGSVSVSYTGGLTGIAATPLLRVANGHTGTLAFDGTNSMTNPGSPGLRFENADGTYNINVTAGTTALSGDSAGIDILPGSDGTNGSQGTFQFGAPGNGFAITSGAGTAFNFQNSAADVTFHGGITKNGTQTGRMVDITGQRSASAITFQTGTLSATSTNAGSTGILLNDADGQVAFGGTTTLGNVAVTTGDAGIDVENGSSGTITFGGSSTVVNAVGELIRIVSSAPTFTYSGGFQRTTGNAIGILAQNNTGGTITFNGDGTTLDGDPVDVTKSLSTGSANAVSLVSNGGTTFHFAGGMTLATTSGTTFNATGGGTVNVSGAGNTVNATAGTGVRITDTNIGATSGVVFRSVSAASGSNGIFLQNTGNTGGGFGVTGDGSTVGSGGTIQGTTGGDGSTGGVGVYLNNTRNVVLQSIISTNHQNFGIQGQTVSGFTLNNSRMHGTHGSNVGFDESVISIAELTGVALFTNDSISGGVEDNVRILNTTGTLDSLVFNNVRMGHMDATQGNDALLVRVQDAAVVKARIRNSTFHGARGDMVQFNIVNSGNGDLVMTGNTFNNTHANIVSGVGGVTLSGGGAGSTPKLRYTITGNTFRGSRGTMLLISKGVGTADYAGTVENNVFGQSGIGAGVNNTTSTEASAINFVLYGGGTHTTRVNNNQIFGYNNYGILMESGDHTGGGGGHGTLNATITNNTIAEPGSFAFPQQGIHLNLGLITDDAGTACLNATGNSLNDSGDSQDIRLRQRMKTKVVLPGYAGGISDNTAVNNFVKANNGNAAALVVAASNSVALGAPDGPGQGFTNGSCPLP